MQTKTIFFCLENRYFMCNLYRARVCTCVSIQFRTNFICHLYNLKFRNCKFLTKREPIVLRRAHTCFYLYFIDCICV